MRGVALWRVPSYERTMVIPLAGRQRWALAALLALTLLYVTLSATEFAATYLALRPNLVSLQRAIRLSPGNAEFHHRLGRFFAFEASLQAYLDAVRLNPHQARYWFDLAAVQNVLGNASAHRDALEHALRAEPTNPEGAWEAANFFLVQGETDRALQEFRVVLENNPSLAGVCLQSCWRARPDVDSLLRDAIPHRVDSLSAFLTLLWTKHETDGAIKVWDQLINLRQKFDQSLLFDQVRYLIDAHRPDAALRAWEQSVSLLDLSGYLPGSDNLIVNGDFSLDILNGGLDWTYQDQSSVHLQLDSTDFHQGPRSLSITFDGPGVTSAGIHQWIPVQGNTPYDFTAYYKSSEFEGAGGPQIVLRDAYSAQPVFISDPLNGADFWKPVHGHFLTSGSTNLLVVNVERIPPGSPMRGRLWVDDLQLSASSAKDGQ